MRAGPSNLASYFSESPQNSCTKTIPEDADLQRAIELSEAEARLSTLTEDELLQQALEASRFEADRSKSVKRSISIEEDSEEARAEKEPKKIKPDTIREVTEKPVLTTESFGDKEEIINRLNGSLDLIYCKGWIKKEDRSKLRNWMLNELTWHRVTYTSLRSKQKIVTPRFTATFGKDDTGAPESVYLVKPKTIPPILDQLRLELERKTGSRFNAIIINFYQDGNDSISYHADDESFLGSLPTIASLSLGSSRDFYLRRKFAENCESSNKQQFYTKGSGPAASRLTEKMKLDDGDLVVMRGKTQSEWEHCIPKRAKAGGRINLTFRKVISVKGTNNFQRYNRGLPTDDECRTFRWDAKKQIMKPGIGGI